MTSPETLRGLYTYLTPWLRVPLLCSRGSVRPQRQRDVQPPAQVHGGIVGRLLSRLRPQVEGVAAAATLEAVEVMLLQVGGKAAAGAGGGAVQRAGAALLRAVGRLRLEAEQVEDGSQGDGGAHGGEVDGWSSGDIGLTLAAGVLGLPQLLPALAGRHQLAITLGEDVRVAAFEPGLGRDRRERCPGDGPG